MRQPYFMNTNERESDQNYLLNSMGIKELHNLLYQMEPLQSDTQFYMLNVFWE